VTSNQKDYGRDHDGSSSASTAHAGQRQDDDQDAGKDCNDPRFFMAVIHQRGQPMNFMRLHWHFSITTPRCKDLFFARPPFCQSILSERIGCESIRRMVSARCVGTRHPLPFRLWRRFGSPGGGCAAPANPTAGASAVAATSSRPEWRPGDRWVYGWMSRSEIGTKTVKVVEIRAINKVTSVRDQRDVDEYWCAPEVRFSINWVGRRGDAQFEEQFRAYRQRSRLIPGPPSSAPPSTTK